ncbi:MAG TPA: hypothetical protein VFA04_23910 [Bryobacteraceae bacterium]|nr:hypothetical protein [Bryobacteraceae bacterium]
MTELRLRRDALRIFKAALAAADPAAAIRKPYTLPLGQALCPPRPQTAVWEEAGAGTARLPRLALGPAVHYVGQALGLRRALSPPGVVVQFAEGGARFD